jgi:hypothetical protein
VNGSDPKAGILVTFSTASVCHVPLRYDSYVGHQTTYSDIGSSTGDALTAHNASSLFLSTWHLLIALLLIVWGALYISGRRNRVTDEKPKRIPDRPDRDEGGVGGLN